MLGINLQLVIGKQFLKDGTLELKERGKEEKNAVTAEGVLEKIRAALHG
ncbi:MAG: His/Gly/Thr/Pro-type tRNA ligase C-terminal domain-containing protein [Candidatus Omnitrophica bacterium]|nr:His/Gly/Thr/Pro-type tRNA ligase C-terminal domain-containing protein [Candidatus Omnitrophota bacterium]